MNTLPPDYPESRNMRLEGAALAYDGEQVDLRASELPSTRHMSWLNAHILIRAKLTRREMKILSHRR